MHSCLSLLLVLSPAFLLGQPIQLTEDFSGYPDGADGAPRWYNSSALWQVSDGAMQFEGPMSIAYLQEHPRFTHTTTEATVVIREAASTGWKVAAVCLYADNKNLWHLALAQKPDESDGGHFCELTQLYQGAWPTHTHARQTAFKGGDFDWQYGTPYRMRLSLTPEGIDGRVTDLDGAEHVHFAFEFTGPAVAVGRPALRASGFRGTYDDIAIQADGPLPDPPAEAKAVPEYDVAASDVFTDEATGFFRSLKRDGRWWIVDPTGHAFYAIGTDHCRYTGHWCQQLGYAPYGKRNDAKWASSDAWALRATERLKSWGFNLLGAGNGHECRYKGLAHTDFVSFGSMFSEFDDICLKVHWTGFPNVFSPRWPSYCDRRARDACRDNTNDPWLLGYFLDNELEWYGKSHTEWGLFEEAMKKPPEHTAKQALLGYLKGKYPTIEQFNEAWGTQVASFDAGLQMEALSGPNADTVKADKIGFVRLVADEYFKHTTAAIRKYDPNHMIIGCRFAARAPAGIWDICGNYCDIVTFNYYGRVDMNQGTAPGHVETFTDYYQQAQKPLMITEWSFPALDSGLPCKHGAGMRVDTQAQKAECFRIYQEMFFRLPFMVGSDYFMWVDEPAQGISDTFPEDSNYGLVDEHDRPYYTLTAMAKKVNGTAYELHDGRFAQIGVRQPGIVYNTGDSPAEVTIRIWTDGHAQESRVALEGGQEKHLELATPATPGAHLLAVEVDPDRELADADRSDNLWFDLAWVEGLRPPEAITRQRMAALSVANCSGQPIPDAVATAIIPRHIAASRAWFLPGVYSAQGVPVPCQRDQSELAVGVGTLGPWECRTYTVEWRTDRRRGMPAGPISVDTDDGAHTIDNGVLSLTAPVNGPGNLFDRVALEDVTLGTYNPLIFQEVDGQNLWVKTSRCATSVDVGPVRARVRARARGGDAPPITAVDDRGAPEQQQALPVPFEVTHTITVHPRTGWFLARLDRIRNISDRPLTLKGYFFYLNGTIGGDAQGDMPAGPDVPNYYDIVGGAWQDAEADLVYGAVPLAQQITTRFWLDGAGGQHPDAHRQLDEPVVIQPGDIYTDPAQPSLLVYGGELSAKPWKQMRQTAAGLQSLRVQMWQLQ